MDWRGMAPVTVGHGSVERLDATPAELGQVLVVAAPRSGEGQRRRGLHRRGGLTSEGEWRVLSL